MWQPDMTAGLVTLKLQLANLIITCLLLKSTRIFQITHLRLELMNQHLDDSLIPE